MNKILQCPQCGSQNVNVQVASLVQYKKKGCIYRLFIGWWLELLLWLCLTIPMLLFKLFWAKGKIQTKINSYMVCQNCWYTQKVK